MSKSYAVNDMVIVKKTGQEHQVVQVLYLSEGKVEPSYKLNNGTHYWEHELKSDNE